MPKITKAHGPTTGEPDPSRAEVVSQVAEPDETPAAEASPAGEEQGRGRDAASDDTTGPDDASVGDEPAAVLKTSTRRRTARG